MNIAITGGAGYVGSALVPILLAKGHRLTVLDAFWFGDHLPFHPYLRKLRGDIRNKSNLKEAFEGQDAIIHLACVSNDPSFDMNPEAGKQINYDCFRDILDLSRKNKIQRFIYASSSSVYGVSDLGEVTEDSPKNPLTDYSKYKLACEEELKGFGSGGAWTIIRPATVCGYAPRMRMDLVVNILTANALVNKKIIIHGKTQKRPNINIQDMVRAYDFVLSANEKDVDQQIFNVGFENKTLAELAELVRTTAGSDITIQEEPANDPRSYHINSDRIKALGFSTSFSIADAIKSIGKAYKRGEIFCPLTNSSYHNIKRMKELKIV